MKNKQSRVGQRLSTKNLAVGKTFLSIQEKVERIEHSAVSCVHISGETGTGKERIAQLFQPVVSIDCGALPEEIVESELFGCVKGAFTGATGNRKGLLDLTCGGWVFLDEIGNLSMRAQKALLRAIGEREIRPVGARSPHKVHFKLISATNENLEQKVKGQEFRQDLLERLREFEVELKPLRERKEEIPDLLNYFCQNLAGGPYQMDPFTQQVLERYHYALGNIRELRRVLVAMTVHKLPDGSLPFSALPRSILQDVGPIQAVDPPQQSRREVIQIAWSPGTSWAELSNDCLAAVIKRTCQKKTYSLRELAPILGLERSTLSRRVQDLADEGRLTPKELTTFLKARNEQEKTAKQRYVC